MSPPIPPPVQPRPRPSRRTALILVLVFGLVAIGGFVTAAMALTAMGSRSAHALALPEADDLRVRADNLTEAVREERAAAMASFTGERGADPDLLRRLRGQTDIKVRRYRSRETDPRRLREAGRPVVDAHRRFLRQVAELSRIRDGADAKDRDPVRVLESYTAVIEAGDAVSAKATLVRDPAVGPDVRARLGARRIYELLGQEEALLGIAIADGRFRRPVYQRFARAVEERRSQDRRLSAALTPAGREELRREVSGASTWADVRELEDLAIRSGRRGQVGVTAADSRALPRVQRLYARYELTLQYRLNERAGSSEPQQATRHVPLILAGGGVGVSALVGVLVAGLLARNARVRERYQGPLGYGARA